MNEMLHFIENLLDTNSKRIIHVGFNKNDELSSMIPDLSNNKILTTSEVGSRTFSITPKGNIITVCLTE